MDLTVTAIYRGEALNGHMDSMAAAEAIKGHVDFIAAAAGHAYGADVRSTGRIHAVEKSSFKLIQIFEIARDTAGILMAALPILPAPRDVDGIISLVKSGFDLLIHLQGEKPRSVTYSDNGSAAVTNNNGTVQVFNNSTVNFIFHSSASRSVQKFVGNPLSGEAESLELLFNKKIVLKATNKHAYCFKDVTRDEAGHVARQDIELRVISPVLEGTAQWKLHDGGRTLTAKIEDSAFLKRVDDGLEKFGRGDRILARLRTEQSFGPKRGLRMKYFIEEVLRRTGGDDQQVDLF